MTVSKVAMPSYLSKNLSGCCSMCGVLVRRFQLRRRLLTSHPTRTLHLAARQLLDSRARSLSTRARRAFLGARRLAAKRAREFTPCLSLSRCVRLGAIWHACATSCDAPRNRSNQGRPAASRMWCTRITPAASGTTTGHRTTTFGLSFLINSAV